MKKVFAFVAILFLVLAYSCNQATTGNEIIATDSTTVDSASLVKVAPVDTVALPKIDTTKVK